MLRILGIVVVASLCVGLAPAAAGEIQDATIAAAEAHQVVFENEHVRVISAMASPGHKSPMHSHPPGMVISLGTARIHLTNSDGTRQMWDLRPGTVFWGDGAEHSWELLAGEVNVIVVEVKAAKAAAAAAE